MTSSKKGPAGQGGSALAGLTLEQKRALAARLAKRKQAAASAAAPPRPRRLPASYSQARLWFLHQLDPEGAAYNNFLALELQGQLNSPALEASIDALERRHESLRTLFTLVEGEPQQVVALAPPKRRPLPVVDLSALAPQLREQAAAGLLHRACTDPFDLEKGLRGGLLRTLEVRLEPTLTRLALSLHHTVSDEWSLGVLAKELSVLYAGFRTSLTTVPALPKLPIQYGDYAQWQRRRLSGERRQELLGYWRERLGEAPPPLELPLDRPRPAVESGAGALQGRLLSPEFRRRLEALGRAHGASMFMTVTAALAVLLGRLTHHDDLCLGTPYANRDRAEVQGMVGVLINTLAMRFQLDGAAPFTAALGAARREVLGATAHQELPFEVLVAELAGHRDLRRSPFFQVMVVLQAEDPAAGPPLPGLESFLLPLGDGGAVFDWTFILREAPDGLRMVLEYRSQLFDTTTAARTLEQLETLLVGLVERPETPLLELPLLSAAARHQALVEWGIGARQGAVEDIVERVLQVAAASPQALAVAAPESDDAAGSSASGSSSGPLTYAQLAQSSGAVAAALVAAARRSSGQESLSGQSSDEPVMGLFFDRRPELLVAMFAALRAGVAFVPLDPALPPARLAYLMAASGARWVLTAEDLRSTVPAEIEAPVLAFEDLAAEGKALVTEGEKLPQSLLEGSFHPERLAYVIFTSGSTGQPKGAMVSREALSRFSFMVSRSLGLGPEDRVLQLAAPGFDVILQEVFPTWAVGATVVMPQTDLGDPRELNRAVEQWGVSAVELPAALWQQWLAHLEALDRPAPPSLRFAVVGGEAVRRNLLPRWLARCPHLVHVFGLTETTCTNSFEHLEAGVRPRGLFALPLGLPEEDNDFHLLDARLEPLPVGGVGDLYIGGPLVGRGYRAQPRRTAERFLPDPFTVEPGGRLYFTGDRARRLADGRTEFLGRADTQLKVRGYRIEPGEVESAMMALPMVALAAVDARGEGDRRSLVGWYQPSGAGEQAGDGDAAAISERVRGALAEALPPWMVPSLLVSMESMPLSPNGKVDRQRLPDPWEQTEEDSQRPSEPPSTALEEQLLALWQEVLGRPVDSVHQDFFALGGHSLLAVRLLTRVQEDLGVEVPLRALFEAPSVAALAQRVTALEGSGSGEESPPTAADRSKPLPLSFAQEHLWVLHQLEGTGAAYSLPFTLGLRGELVPAALAAALGAVVERHEVLRTTLASVDESTTGAERIEGGSAASHGSGTPHQLIAAPREVPVPLVDLRHLPEELRQRASEELLGAAANRPFDLARGPLLRALLLRRGPEDHALSLNLHHAVCDEWSLGILVREMGTAYEAAADLATASSAESDAPAPLRVAALESLGAPLELQYADYAAWQRQRLEGDRRQQLVDYWREALADLEPLDLPFDAPRPPLQTFRGGAVPVTLSAPALSALEAAAAEAGGTLFMALLALFQAQLGRLAQRDDIAVGSPLAGRGRPEWQGLVGYFVNMLVLRGQLDGDPSFRELMQRTRSRAVAALDHGDLPFEMLVEELAPRRDLARNPLFQVAFQLDAEAPPEPRAGRLELTTLPAGAVWAKFDLTLSLETRPGGEEGASPYLGGALVYNSDLFDATTARRWAQAFESVVEAAAAAVDLPISRWPWLSSAQQHQLLREWNDTRPLAPATFQPVHRRLQAHAEVSPQLPAVESEGRVWSYGQLHARAQELSTALAALDVGPGSVVAVALPRSPRWVASLVAVLQRGAAYLPLDLSLPAERLQSIVSDARCRAVIVATEGEEPVLWRPTESGVPAPALLEVTAEGAPARAPRRLRSSSLEVAVGAEDLAYVIYTSGSTGKPKGVEVRHGGLAQLVDWHLRRYSVRPEDRASHLAGLGFDASVWELWPYLAAGATVVLTSDALRTDPLQLQEWLSQEAITLSFLPTPVADEMLRHDPRRVAATARAGSPLRAVLTGGDRLTGRPRPSLPWELVNHYGPTENSVVATAGPVTPGYPGRPGASVVHGAGRVSEARAPSIGRPITGTQVLLLDDGGELVPPGAVGELCLAGVGLARGYRRMAGRTATSFRPNPFAAEPGERLYATGDLARWRPDGSLDFLGRRDHQVQLRGLRLELGEVESVLASCEGVRAAVAQVWHAPTAEQDSAVDSPGRLVAWLLPTSEAGEMDDSSWQELQAAAEAVARRHLPAAAVTSTWVRLEELPLTPNGKVDRRRLPAPQDSGPRRAPASATEKALAQLWRELLGVEEVALEDGFFTLGGHSLVAVRLVAAVRETLGVELELAAVFETATLEELAQRVESAAAASGPTLRRVPRDEAAQNGDLPLSFAQQRLWLLDELMPGTALYNVPLVLDLASELKVLLPADGTRSPAAHRQMEAAAASSRAALDMAAALGAVVARHEVLRTVFPAQDGSASQKILPPAPVDLPLVDLSALPPTARRRAAEEIVAQQALRPFDLARGPLLRGALLDLGIQRPQDAEEPAQAELAQRRLRLALCLHHIVCDAWSLPILVRETSLAYFALQQGRATGSRALKADASPRKLLDQLPLEPLPVQYADYAHWQRAWLADEEEGQLEWWRRTLAGAPSLAQLPTDRPRPPVASHRGAEVRRPLPGSWWQRLEAQAQSAGSTPFLVSLTLFAAWLGRISGQRDLVVGTPVANRRRRSLEGLVGFFLNTLPLRLEAPAGDLGTALEGLSPAVVDALAHQDLPFERLVEALVPERHRSHTPLFQVLFVFEGGEGGGEGVLAPAPQSAGEDAGGEGWRLVPSRDEGFDGDLAVTPASTGTAKFELTVALRRLSGGGRATGGGLEADGGWELGLEYATDLFDATTAARLAATFQRLMESALESPEAALPSLSLLGAAETHQLVVEWNTVPEPRSYPNGGLHSPSLPALAAAEARRYRHREALVWPATSSSATAGDRSFTYGQVHRWAAVLAERLQALGAGAETKVALCLQRGPEMVAAVQGVLASGAACLPLDTAYPDERLRFVLRDGAPRALITDQSLAPRLRPLLPAATELLEVESLPPLETLDPEGEELPLLPVELQDVGPDALYYVIYTSGSTGRPKGIELAHGAMGNLLAWHRDELLGGVRTLQLASLGFDASFHEIYAAWTTGGSLVGVPEDLRRDAAGLGELLREQQVEKAILPVVLLHALAEEHSAGRPLAPSLLELTTTGEQLRITDPVVDLFRQLPGLPLHNHYGPSESHVVTASTLGGEGAPPALQDPRQWPSHPSIGRPLPATQIHIVDEGLQPQPLGVPGELLIGGICLARGYQGRPALTAERFVPDPLGAPGQRLYRTGDLARWHGDGSLEYLGRRDHQVKIRGFRVEPGEVEAALAAHPAVSQAVVTVFDGPGGRALAAWAVPESAASAPDEESLRQHLAATLPDYMVPAALRVLDTLPLNANGKVDRSALPAPQLSATVASAAAVTAAQRVVAAVLGQALESAEPPGLEDDFFALGGHSLVATRAVSRLRRIFRLDDLPLGVLFDHPTVAGVVAELESRWGGAGALETVAQQWLAGGAAAPEAGTAGEARLEAHGEALADRGLAPRPTPAPTASDEQGPHPLSFAQERMYFLARLDPESPAYNVASGARLRGPLDLRALSFALAWVRERHGTLRTTFLDLAEGPRQEVRGAAPLVPRHAAAGLPLVDFSALEPSLAEGAARDLAEAAASRPFDLLGSVPARFLLLRLPADVSGQESPDHVLVACLHHILSDGWTQGLLLTELGQAYGAFRQSELGEGSVALPERLQRLAEEPPLSYHEVARWQRRWLVGEILDGQLGFWRQALAEAPAALELPTDFPRPPMQSFRGGALPIFLDGELSAALGELARRHGATLFMVVLAGFGALLHRLSWQQRIVVGCPVANRSRPELERVAGFFVNTLPLMVDCSPASEDAAEQDEAPSPLTFVELLERVRRGTLEAQAHQDLPFERLVHEMAAGGGARRDPSRNPIFQVLFQLAPEALVAPAPLPGLDTEAFPFEDSGTKFDLALSLVEDRRGISGLLRYASDLFRPETVEDWGRQLVELLRGAVANPEGAALELGLSAADPASEASASPTEALAGESASGEPAGDGAFEEFAFAPVTEPAPEPSPPAEPAFDDFSFDSLSSPVTTPGDPEGSNSGGGDP